MKATILLLIIISNEIELKKLYIFIIQFSYVRDKL
jgi:hypothetical protein